MWGIFKLFLSFYVLLFCLMFVVYSIILQSHAWDVDVGPVLIFRFYLEFLFSFIVH